MNGIADTPRGYRVVVVGGGVAGLVTALSAARRGAHVTLLSREPIGGGSTRLAQGGIAAAVGRDDSCDAHLADTLSAGAGLCDPHAAAVVCSEGPSAISDLVSLGVSFDRRGSELALGREGAHTSARVVHAGGDATGAHVAAALASAARTDGAIEVLEGEDAAEILVENGAAVGVVTTDRGGAVRSRRADAVILATGGSGQLFLHTTNPPGATADGAALAHRAGAALVDLEFVQFHPTALATDASPLPLVTEAARGAGGILRDRRGRAFMAGIHPLADLAPRDVVARAIWERALEDGANVVLDLTHVADLAELFPTLADNAGRIGIDIRREPVPVTPAAHYAMGGVLTDSHGRSTLPGLYAVGECAATGAHGANRLASNSLLEGIVMARRAAAALGHADWPTGPHATPRPQPVGTSGPWIRGEIQRAMWRGVGLVRDSSGLRTAVATLRDLPGPESATTRNMLETARLTAAAAELRRESRGAHFRRDHPATDPGQARRIAWAGGEPHLLPLSPFTHTAKEAA